MTGLSSREIILARIKNALTVKTGYRYAASALEDDYFTDANEDLTSRFENEFTALLGKFYLCSSAQQAYARVGELCSLRQWRSVFCNTAVLQQALHLETLPLINREGMDRSEAALTDCECLIARTGTIVLSAAQPSGRVIPIYTPVHIVIAFAHQLVFDIKDAINLLKAKYDDNLPSMLSLATGPSRTGDIEKTLVVGVHGPREVYVLLIDEPGDTLIP